MQNNGQCWKAGVLLAASLAAARAIASEDPQATPLASTQGTSTQADAQTAQPREVFTTDMVFGRYSANGPDRQSEHRYFSADSVFSRGKPGSDGHPTLLDGAAERLRNSWPEWTRRVQTGHASYYHDSLHGRRTANGERYDRHALTAAHRTLPLGTMLRVINLANQRSVLVRVNDRGPFAAGRALDLSRAAAAVLGYITRGTAQVRMEPVDAAGATAAEPSGSAGAN